MSGYVSKTDILRMLSDIETEINCAEQSLSRSIDVIEAEMRETEDERLSVLEEEIMDLHICINELYRSPQERYAVDKVYRIG
ncbi:DUF5446 family protein [Bacillus halotolerans]